MKLKLKRYPTKGGRLATLDVVRLKAKGRVAISPGISVLGEDRERGRARGYAASLLLFSRLVNVVVGFGIFSPIMRTRVVRVRYGLLAMFRHRAT